MNGLVQRGLGQRLGLLYPPSEQDQTSLGALSSFACERRSTVLAHYAHGPARIWVSTYVWTFTKEGRPATLSFRGSVFSAGFREVMRSSVAAEASSWILPVA